MSFSLIPRKWNGELMLGSFKFHGKGTNKYVSSEMETQVMERFMAKIHWGTQLDGLTHVILME